MVIIVLYYPDHITQHQLQGVLCGREHDCSIILFNKYVLLNYQIKISKILVEIYKKNINFKYCKNDQN